MNMKCACANFHIIYIRPLFFQPLHILIHTVCSFYPSIHLYTYIFSIYFISKNHCCQSSPKSGFGCKCLHCTHANVCDGFCFASFLFKYQTNIISAGIYSVLLSIGTQLVQICSGDADVTFVMSIKLFALYWLSVRLRGSLWAFWQERVKICVFVCVRERNREQELIHQTQIVSVMSLLTGLLWLCLGQCCSGLILHPGDSPDNSTDILSHSHSCGGGQPLPWDRRPQHRGAGGGAWERTTGGRME